MIKNNNQSNELIISFDCNIFSAQAIKNASYDYSGNAWITIEELKNDQIRVALKFKQDQQISSTFEHDFKNHVLDHQVRIDTSKEYKIIREMIIAQAFEPCDNLKDVVKNLTHE